MLLLVLYGLLVYTAVMLYKIHRQLKRITSVFYEAPKKKKAGQKELLEILQKREKEVYKDDED